MAAVRYCLWLSLASLVTVMGMTEPGCAQTIRAYSGGVINSGMPNQPGRLTIVALDSGTSVRGYWLIGAPLAGSGPFRGGWSRDSLFVVTTSATGDTIAWQSPQGDQFIGGTYRIFGGPYVGQGGVWSATMFLTVPSPGSVDRTAIEVGDQSEGTVGRALVYLVREAFRRGSGFRLTELDEPRYQLNVTAMPPDSGSKQTGTIYSTALVYVAGTKAAGWQGRYLSSSVGHCDLSTCAQTAESLVARTDQIVSGLYRDLLAAIQ